MSKLQLTAQEPQPEVSGITPGYGQVAFRWTSACRKITERSVYNPALWDAVRAKRKTSRQVQSIAKVTREAHDAIH